MSNKYETNTNTDSSIEKGSVALERMRKIENKLAATALMLITAVMLTSGCGASENSSAKFDDEYFSNDIPTSISTNNSGGEKINDDWVLNNTQEKTTDVDTQYNIESDNESKFQEDPTIMKVIIGPNEHAKAARVRTSPFVLNNNKITEVTGPITIDLSDTSIPVRVFEDEVNGRWFGFERRMLGRLSSEIAESLRVYDENYMSDDDGIMWVNIQGVKNIVKFPVPEEI